MSIHYQTGIAQGRFINIIRTPSKQWGVCDNKQNNMEDLGLMLYMTVYNSI